MGQRISGAWVFSALAVHSDGEEKSCKGAKVQFRKWRR